MIRYCIRIELPEALSTAIKKLKGAPQANGKSNSHITVVAPRILKVESDEGRLVQILTNCAANLHPILVSETSVGYFGDYETIHIGIQRVDELVEATIVLNLACDPYLEPSISEFDHLPNPHITLVSNLTPQSGRELYLLAWKTDYLFFPFSCQSLQLMKIGPDITHWEPIATLPLSPVG